MKSLPGKGERSGAGGARLRSALLLTACLGVLGACDRLDSLLRVETPSRIPASALEVPANAALIVNGAIADFDCGFGAYTVLGGLIGDELMDATQTADRFPYDRRTMQPTDFRYSQDTCERLGVYRPLQAARAGADNAVELLRGWTDAEVPNRTNLIATALTYAGYSLVLLGEGFCSSVVSTLDANRQPAYGGEISRDSVFKLAVSRFTEAITTAEAAGNTEMLNTSYLGRARALLNLGRYADARADAARIPAGFVKNVTASGVSARRENRVWSQSSATAGDVVSVGEPYRSMNDPRVPVLNTERTSVTGIELWRQLKYPSANTPLPLATAKEARLIIAEADARAGGASLANAIAIIDDFRTAAGQPRFTGTTQQEVLNEVIEQRRRELFLESHHLGDLIRFELPLSPPPGTTYHGGGSYGSQRCLPLPSVERLNNPNIS